MNGFKENGKNSGVDLLLLLIGITNKKPRKGLDLLCANDC